MILPIEYESGARSYRGAQTGFGHRTGAKINAVLAICALLLLGCGSSNHLADYQFQGKKLAAEYEFPPYPEVLTGPYFPGHPKRPVHAVIRLGSRLIKEVEASTLRAKLDSAAQTVNVSAEVAERVLARSSRYLRTSRTDDLDQADFLMEVIIRDYGIDAEEWDAAARFFVDAEVTLLDSYDGRIIWNTRVRERDNITPVIIGTTTVRNIVTAHAFSQLSVEEIESALFHLSKFCADHITDRLRHAIQKARD